jgi:hypothetical protein
VSEDQSPVDHIGKYRILGILGKGGMGIVYKGLDPDIEREVAIKTIRFDTCPDGPIKEEMLARVTREAKAAGRLNHPNIITIHDVFREKDLTYIVMHYVEGQTLEALIGSGRVFSPREVIEVLKPVAEALDYAHANGIVHRDLKPANVLLETSGKPFLADFGVARMETSTMTGPGTTIGTLSYMSPEQVMGKSADGRADIFALGVMLFELLTGEKPFAGDNLSTIVYKIVHVEPRPITEFHRDLPAGYEAVIKRALAKDPAARYQTCRDLIQDLEDPESLSVATKDFELRSGVTEQVPAGRAKTRFLVPGLIAAVAVVVLGAFLVLRPRPARGGSGGAADRGQAPAALPAQPSAADALAADLAKLRESFAAKSYDEAVRLAEAVLRADPSQAEARDYLDKAKAEIRAAGISARLKAGVASFEAGDNLGCVKAMTEVLGSDPGNTVAQDYLYRADTTLSRRDIQGIIDQHHQAEARGDIEGVLKSVAPGQAAAEEEVRYSNIFAIYVGIESKVSGPIDIRFQDRAHATATIPLAVQGLNRKDGRPDTFFFGQRIWDLEKQGNAWKIVRIQEIQQ